MGWAAAIHAARLEKRIKELQQTQGGYSSTSPEPDIYYDPPGYKYHPEEWEWAGAGSSGYRYIGMKNVKD